MDIKKLHSIFKNYEKIFVVDTNIILSDVNSIFLLSNNKKNLLILTETILEELDKFKVGNEDKNYQAREMNRFLAECEIKDRNDVYILLENTKEKENMVEILIIKELNEEIKKPDKRIIKTVINFIEIILSYKKYISNEEEKQLKEKINFISNDINFRTQVFLEGYKAEPFFNNIKQELKDFYKEYVVEEVLSNKDFFNLKELEELKNIETRNNIKILPEYSFIKIIDGNGYPYILARVDENTFEKINKNLDKINLFGIKPKNLKQKIAIYQFLNNKNDIVVIDSVAGTGKTLLALVAALQLQKQGKIDNIIYIRKTIIAGDSSDELGFLPGNLSEKLRGYIHPLKDNIELLIKLKNKKKKKWTKEEIEDAIEKFEIEHNIYYEYEGHLRGRNLKGLIIYDEAQNDSVANLRTLLTRITEGSKVFILGSSKQIDNPYLNQYNNALSFMKNSCGEFSKVQIQGLKLEKSERGRIVEWIENILD